MRIDSLKIFFIFLLFFCSPIAFSQSFEDKQLQNDRVRIAKASAEGLLTQLCDERGIDFEKIVNIYIRAFKYEKKLEVWVQGDFNSDYIKLKEYNFCASSGSLGPKRKQGDMQIPEGYYFVSRFNPNSNYYLSLGVNYPNPSDSKRSDERRLGGDIYIHGDCMTIGCIPITDEGIKELYWLSVKAKSNGQTDIPIHIFPYKFDEHSMTERSTTGNYERDSMLLKFWENLQDGYYYFEINRKPPLIIIDDKGDYHYL